MTAYTETKINRLFNKDAYGVIVGKKLKADPAEPREVIVCRAKDCTEKLFIARGQILYPICKKHRENLRKN